MWRSIIVAALVLLAAVAVSAARPAQRSATAFARCYGIDSGSQPTATLNGRLVYASGDSIRSIRLDGTDDRLLFSSNGPVDYPSVSPNGRLIAFEKEGNSIWLMNSDGSDAHYVTTGTTPAFAPDSERLAIGGAATGASQVALDVIGIDGTGRRTLAVDAKNSPEPSWSPDGFYIAFDSLANDYYGRTALHVVNQNGQETFLTYPAEAASWSPNGKLIAYSAENLRAGKQVGIVKSDGTGRRLLTPRSSRFSANSPTWSADGTTLTYALSLANLKPRDGVFWQVGASGRGRHPIADDCRFGTGASDRIHGTSRPDQIYALEGNDTIDVRGGGRDFVDCGPGRDVVRVDRRDVIARDCERRLR